VRHWLTVAALALFVACASAAPPPGGAEDPAPPRVVRITPDSNAVNVTDRVVTFHFDETINDRGSGAQEVSNYFLVSPSEGNARVTWRRSRIEVRPRAGFRPNTAYTVTLLPGLTDLRNNVMREGARVVFSTGPTIPTLRITGVAFDWAGERPAARALVQAVTRDSVTWLAQSDSAGRFEIGPLPAGTYLVRAIVDANGNRALDRNESFDSLTVVAPPAAPIELLTIARDTIAPRILSVAPVDSLSVRATFDRPLDPRALPAATAFRLVGPDSAAIAITAALTPLQEVAAARIVVEARADSIRRADSVAGRPPAPAPRPAAAPAVTLRRPSIPPPPTTLLLRIARPLTPAATYRLAVISARGISGRSGESERSFTTPRPPAAADSVRRVTPTTTPPTRPLPPSARS